MPRPAPLLAAALALLAACGKSDPPASPSAPPTGASTPSASTPAAPVGTQEGAAGARAVVDAYLAAAKVPDEAAMLALGTPEWREREKTWQKGFTVNIVRKGYALKSAEVREPEVSGETATVSVRAVFLDQGRDDPEGMRFSLERREGRWWISDLR
jgi:hypothetical protein